MVASSAGTDELAPGRLADLLDVSRARVAGKLEGGGQAPSRRPPAGDLVQLSVRVPDEVRRAVRAAAFRRGSSVQQLVLDALREHLRRVEEVDEPGSGLAEFAADYWELVRRGDYRRDIDALDDPDLAVQ